MLTRGPVTFCAMLSRILDLGKQSTLLPAAFCLLVQQYCDSSMGVQLAVNGCSSSLPLQRQQQFQLRPDSPRTRLPMSLMLRCRWCGGAPPPWAAPSSAAGAASAAPHGRTAAWWPAATARQATS